MRRILLGGILLVLLQGQVHGQSLEIKNIEIKGNKFIVYYDLMDSVVNRSYTIRVYSSADGFINPLQKISGDVGLDVKTGMNRKVEWSFLEEPGSMAEGKLMVELRARVFVPFIKTESINQYKVFKRSRTYNLTWSGGSAQNVLNFDLYRGDRKVASFPNIGNAGHHSFKFPSHIKPGNNYRFRISDSKNADEVVYSNTFKIKRRIPLVVKSAVVLAAGASVFLLLNKDEGGGGGNGLPDPNIPDDPN